MGILYLTRHAQERLQQRGVKQNVFVLICEYGEYHTDKRGGIVVILPRWKLDKLLQSKHTPPEVKRMIRSDYDRISNKKIVLSDDDVITVMNVG